MRESLVPVVDTLGSLLPGINTGSNIDIHTHTGTGSGSSHRRSRATASWSSNGGTSRWLRAGASSGTVWWQRHSSEQSISHRHSHTSQYVLLKYSLPHCVTDIATLARNEVKTVKSSEN